jgi:preprotein translocase subunit Sec61beta
MSPQSQAGIQSFYDAQTNGPKLNPKIVLAVVVVFAVIIILVNHFVFYG